MVEMNAWKTGLRDSTRHVRHSEISNSRKHVLGFLMYWAQRENIAGAR